MSDDLIVALIEAGTPAPLVARVARELARADAERAILADRRQHERERKARSRDVTGQDVTGRDSADTPGQPPLSDKESVPHTPFKENNSHPGHVPPARKAGFVLPGRIPAEPWRDFLEMRRRIGKPMTVRAMELAVGELDKLADAGWPPGDCLNHSTLNSYQGIFPPKSKDQANGHGRLVQRETGANGLGRTQQAADRLIAKLGERMA